MSELDVVFIDGKPISEWDVRQWFTFVELEQAHDTLRSAGVIIDTRETLKPKRARRKDAGKPRPTVENPQDKAQRELLGEA